MKMDKTAKIANILSKYPKWNKEVKKWKKRMRHVNWIPRIYRKRKHLGNLVYSVMYLASRKK